MAAMIVDPARVHAFEDAAAFEAWLAAHHAREPEVWVRIYKVRSGTPSITWAEAVPVALAWGWIDAVRKSLDEVSFLQRLTPRGPKSIWSEINVGHVERLITEGRMQPPGLKQVEAAKADGRWDAAYRIKGAEIPDDLRAAIAADAQAQATFETLTAQNRFALIFRLQALKTQAGRDKAIARFVAMLARGEALHPQARRT